MKILIIDDEPDVRRIAQLSLSTVGRMDVVTASGAEEGVRAAAADAPDAILLDVSMPATDGPTTLGLLRANPVTAAIPIIFVTANAMTDELNHLRNLGAAGVITKPFKVMELPAQVRAILAAPESRL